MNEAVSICIVNELAQQRKKKFQHFLRSTSEKKILLHLHEDE